MLKITTMLLYVAAILCLSFMGCSEGATDKRIEPGSISKTAAPRPQYDLEKIVYQVISDQVRAIGTVSAYQEVEISPEVSGKIDKIYFNVGDHLKQGDLLVEIDAESRLIAVEKKRAILQKAEAGARKAQKDARKGDDLFKEGVISDSESDDILLDRQIAEAELKLARAELRDAEKNLRDTKITAPFEGKVALKNVEVGQLVTPGENLLTLVEIKRIKIFVYISELDIAAIAEGAGAEVLLDSLEGKVFSGKVATIGLKADDSTRTFPVEIVVLNAAEDLLPGMVARVIIKSQTPKKAIVIPKKAVRTVSGINVVYVMKNGKIERRRIYPGPERGDRIVVEKGLAAGEDLIVSGPAAANVAKK